MVALVTMKVGVTLYSRSHNRRSRLSTRPVWHPNAPLQPARPLVSSSPRDPRMGVLACHYQKVADMWL